MLRTVCFLAFAAALFFLGGDTNTQQSQAWEWCMNRGNRFSPDTQNSGCTTVIQSGSETGYNLSVAFNNRANSYLDQEDYGRAISDYDQAIQIRPSATHFFNRGLAYCAKGNSDHAIADFNMAIKLDPKYAERRFGICSPRAIV